MPPPLAAEVATNGLPVLGMLCCGLLLAGLAAVLAIRRWRRRSTRPGGPRRPPTRRPLLDHAPPEWRDRPAPGQIWWADVPFTDGSGSKVRPCLVLRTGPRQIEALKITSRDKSHRRDHIRIPTAGWDAHADHDSWLDLAQVFVLPDRSFADRAGACDPRTWRQVRRGQPTGWWR